MIRSNNDYEIGMILKGLYDWNVIIKSVDDHERKMTTRKNFS